MMKKFLNLLCAITFAALAWVVFILFVLTIFVSPQTEDYNNLMTYNDTSWYCESPAAALHFPSAGYGFNVFFLDDLQMAQVCCGPGQVVDFYDLSGNTLFYSFARFTRDGQTMTLKVNRENDPLFDGKYKKLVFHRISENEFMELTKDVVWPEEFSEIRAEIHAGALELEAAQSACENPSQSSTPAK